MTAGASRTYEAFGLRLRLPFECLPLQPCADGDADVNVVAGPVPAALTSPLARGEHWEAEAGRILFLCGGSARFLVEEGRRVTVDRLPGASDRVLAWCFVELVLPALLHLRGLLVLHGTTVSAGDRAVTLSGVSGAGKSTTAASLLRRGCTMVSDDITVLRRDDRRVDVLPGLPQLALCDDAFERLHDVGTPLEPRTWPGPKRRILPAIVNHVNGVGLDALYVLHPHDSPELTMRELRGSEKFAALQACVYGPLPAHEHTRVFPVVAAVLTSVRVIEIGRPSGRWTSPEIAGRILADASAPAPGMALR